VAAEVPKKVFRVLSLDGGGAKGFYTLGVLKEVEAKLQDLRWLRPHLRHQHRGHHRCASVQQSSTTYQSIKNVLEHGDAPYASKQIDTFLQGSYGNDTNIWGDSDVDIVLRTRSIFHYNIDALPGPQQTEFKRKHPAAEYNLKAFRTDVVTWTQAKYGADLDTSGKRALRLKQNGNRRSSDVLPVAPHKKFTRYVGEQPGDQDFVEGVLFFTTDGTSIINYPAQHSKNLTAKHQAANNQLKPTVRIYKNIRNKMVEGGIIKAGTAPSYFIEGMLSNVPSEHFSTDRQKTVEACWAWINASDHASLMCANGIHPLSGDNLATSWPIQGYIDFLAGVQKLWHAW
jgi:hypothetical protein